MSAYGLQTLLVNAVTDRALRARLLADAPTAYSPFELSAAEIAGLRNIRASTLEEYAHQAHCLFYGEDPLTGEPTSDVLPPKQRCEERAVG
jgi:hypothetical protein